MTDKTLLHLLTRIRGSETWAAELGSHFSEVRDWRKLVRRLEENAIAPLALEHVQHHELLVDPVFLMSLRALALRHRGACDTRYQTLRTIQAAFNTAGVRFVALKGLALAPLIYPRDNLRPMADMDVLLSTEQLKPAADILRNIGFRLPEKHPGRFMHWGHQLPNATKKINRFTISIEIHHNAFAQDVPGSLCFEDAIATAQTVRWRELEFPALDHELMLHHICRHLAGLHPGDFIKLINMLDAVQYAVSYFDEIDWKKMERQYSHAVNTLRCLHPIIPLDERLREKVGHLAQREIPGTGRVMPALSRIYRKKVSLPQKLRLLFNPFDWWLHLYYNVSPTDSLLPVKLFRHPLNLMKWLGRRLFSALIEGANLDK